MPWHPNLEELPMINKQTARCLMAALLLAAPCARAQFAVLDVASVAQLIQQASILTEQLQTVRSELTQAQALYQSVTGGRGMEQLLGGINRNYLPPDLTSLMAAIDGAGALGRQIQSLIDANAVLSPQSLAALSVTEQNAIGEARRAVAALQGLGAQALSVSSNRFDSLQGLIGAIPGAADEKGALDLLARVGAEQTMLQNEQAKLGTLYELAQAQAQSASERAREQIVAGHGRFDSRFRPVAR
jgi:type IV secretion system protein VirB5